MTPEMEMQSEDMHTMDGVREENADKRVYIANGGDHEAPGGMRDPDHSVCLLGRSDSQIR